LVCGDEGYHDSRESGEELTYNNQDHKGEGFFAANPKISPSARIRTIPTMPATVEGSKLKTKVTPPTRN
jgi:hypothetical protein